MNEFCIIIANAGRPSNGFDKTKLDSILAEYPEIEIIDAKVWKQMDLALRCRSESIAYTLRLCKKMVESGLYFESI